MTTTRLHPPVALARGSRDRAQPSEVPLTNARVRFLLAAVSLGSLLLGLISLAVGAGGLREVCLTVFCLIGIGSAPWQADVTLRLAARLTLTLITGLAVLTFGSMGMLAARSWHPLALFAVVAAPCAWFHLVGLRSAFADVRLLHVAGWPAMRVRPPMLALVGGGGALCMAAALTHRHVDPGFYGFPTQIGLAWYAGFALILIGLVS